MDRCEDIDLLSRLIITCFNNKCNSRSNGGMLVSGLPVHADTNRCIIALQKRVVNKQKSIHKLSYYRLCKKTVRK